MQRTCSYCDIPASGTERLCTQCGAALPPLPPLRAEQEEEDKLVTWVEPTETAFAVRIPPGWLAQGGVNRSGPYGIPHCLFETSSSAERTVGVRIGCIPWQFLDAAPAASGQQASGWLGGLLNSLAQAVASSAANLAALSGVPSLAYSDAASFAQRWLLPRLAQEGRPGLAVLAVREAPEAQRALQERAARDAARHGLSGPVASSVADVTCRFGPAGATMIETLRIATTRVGAGDAWSGPTQPPVWFAEILWSWYGREAEVATWKSTLERVALSYEPNPSWLAQCEAQVQQHVLAQQQEGRWRQQQLTSTLSQTSDIITSGWWSRQQIHQQHQAMRTPSATSSDWSQQWSNATLGREDRYDDQGNHYSVPSGHERVWRDLHGNLHSGGYTTLPEPGWQELYRSPGS